MADARTLVRPADVRAALPALERARFADPQHQRFIDRLRELLNTRFGAAGPLAERAPTWGELADAGLVDLSAFGPRPRVGLNGADGESGPPGEAANADEMPTAPTGFTGVGAATTAILKWDAPTTAGYAYTELWAAGVDNVGVAVRIQTPSARVAADRVGASGIDKWYWIRHVSRGGKIGPFQAVSGLKVTTGSATGAQASGAYDELIVARGVIVEALIGDEEVGNSKIRNLSVDDAKMLNVGVDKLLAGSLAVGRYIQSTNYAPNVSGWRISADGYAEFGNVKVRGDVQATSLNGQIIGNGHIQPGAVTYDKLSVGFLSAITANLGDVTAGRLSMQGAGESYIRSNTKQYDDANQDGWILARNPDGSAYVHFKTGGMGAGRSIFRMHSNGEALLYFGNGAFSVNQAGQLFCNSATISGNVTANSLTANTVTTAHVAGGGQITLPVFADASAGFFEVVPADGRQVWEVTLADGWIDSAGYPVIVFFHTPRPIQAQVSSPNAGVSVRLQYLVQAAGADSRILGDTGLADQFAAADMGSAMCQIAMPFGMTYVRVAVRMTANGNPGVAPIGPNGPSQVVAPSNRALTLLACKR